MVLLASSVCSLMEEFKRLCKLPDGRDWWWEKLSLVLVDKALFSKGLIQLSADGWNCTPSLVAFWPEVTQPYSWIKPRGYTSKGTIPDCCCQFLHPCGESLLIHSSTGDPPTLAGSFGSVSYGITAPFLWVLVHAMFCFFPSKTGVFISSIGMGFEFIMIVPLLQSCCGCYFVFGNGISFLVVSKSVGGCSPASCYFDSLTGGDEHISFYSTILNQNPRNCISVWKMYCQMYYYIEHKEDILYRPNDIQK